MRDPSNKLIGGVCSGLAKYLNMDVNLVRILTVIISLFTGVPIILYIIALFVMPEEQSAPPQPPYVNGPQAGGYGTGYEQQSYQQPAYGAPAQSPAPTPAVDEVWGSGGAPWEQPATAPRPTSAPEQQTWQQPVTAESAGDPVAEPTGYDTAPTTAGADKQSPATAAPEDAPAAAPEPEPVPESGAPEAPAEEASSWESAPADPETDKKD
jgi:phage shock protein PspC (stress-responsive transcriptional regulator)